MTPRSNPPCVGPRLALALALLAPALAAGDPVSSAFRKAAKGAEKAVKAASVSEVGQAKGALSDSLKAFVAGDDALELALANAVNALTHAVARTNSAARAEAEALANAGAALLDDLVGPLPDDLRDGGGGAWDDFQQRTEAQLAKTDAKLEALFAKFIKGAVKQAGKLGFDPDPRWRVRGHLDIVGGVEGPLLASLAPAVGLADTSFAGSQIVVEARFLNASDDFLQVIGVDFRGLGDPTLEVTEGDGSAIVSDPLVPDADGVIVDAMLLSRSTPQPLRVQLVASTEAILDEVVGSVPGLVPTPKPIVKQFGKRLKQELAFGGKQLGASTKELGQSFKGLLMSQKQDLLTPGATLEGGISSVRSALGNDCFWLGVTMRAPVNAAGQQLSDEELGDEAVDADLLPDGQGAYTKALKTLDRKARAADAKRAKLLTAFGTKVDKQAKDVEVQLDVLPEPRPPQQGELLDLGGLDFPLIVDVRPVLGALAFVEDATPPYELLMAGLAKQGLASAELDLTEQPDGDTIALAGLLSEGSGAFEAKVPLLGELPVAGWLFRSQNSGQERRKLLVFLKPDILLDDTK